MDGSQVGRGCRVLLVGVVLAWGVYKGQRGHTTAARHLEVLKKVRPLLPEAAEVVLLGDAEYDAPEMLSWVQSETSWQFVMRTAPNFLTQQGNDWHKLGSFEVTHGRSTHAPFDCFHPGSRFASPKRLSLLIATCLAYIWMVCLGLLTLAAADHKLIDRTDRVGKSIFRLGLDWFKYLLKRNLPL